MEAFKMNKKTYIAMAPGAMLRVIKIINLLEPSEDAIVIPTGESTIEILTTFEMNNKYYIAANSHTSKIDIYDIESKAVEYSLEGHTAKIRSLIMYEDNGKLFLISGSYDMTIKVWDVSAKSCVATLEGHKHWIWSLALYKKDNVTCLASAGYDSVVKIWDLASFTCTSTLTGHSRSVLSLTTFYVGDKPFGASGSFSEIKIWDLSSNTLVATLDKHPRWIYTLKALVIQNEPYLLSGGDDGLIRFWSVDSLKGSVKLAKTLKHDNIKMEGDELNDVRVLDTFMDDENKVPYLVSGHWLGDIYLWNDEPVDETPGQ